MNAKFFVAILFISSIFISNTAHSDPNLDNLVIKKAIDMGVDPTVFLAVITHESGDPDENWKINPWALNIGGKGIYPKNREDAYRYLITAIMSGEKTIGIGPGQIEWRFHREKFEHLWNALDTETNLAKAADYYQEMLKICQGDEWCAVGYYHNRNPALASTYKAKVKKRWVEIQQRYALR